MGHPQSVNHPAFWMARGYGLFAANPLGQADFQKRRGLENPQHFRYTLNTGDQGIFRYKMVIYEGTRSVDEIERAYREYTKQQLPEVQ